MSCTRFICLGRKFSRSSAMRPSSFDEVHALQEEARNLKEQIQTKQDQARDTSLTGESGSVQCLGNIKLAERKILEGHLSRVYALQWGADSRNLLSAAQGGRLINWDSYAAEILHVIQLPFNWVMTCASSPNFEAVASGGMDNACTVHVLGRPVQQPTSVHTLKGHTDYVSSCRFVDNNQIVTCSGDSKCLLWDVERTEAHEEFVGHTESVTSVALAPDCRTFVTGSCDTTAKLWDMRTRRCELTFEGHDRDVNAITFFPSGMAFGTGSDDSTCRLHDIRAGQSIATYAVDQQNTGVTSLVFSKSGRVLFAGFDDYDCQAWDTLKGRSLGEWAGKEQRVSCMDITPDGKALATGSWNSALKIWN